MSGAASRGKFWLACVSSARGMPSIPRSVWGTGFGWSPSRPRAVEVRRARIVSEPVSMYIRCAYEVTDGLNMAAGEQVRRLSWRRATSIALSANDLVPVRTPERLGPPK